MKRREFLTMVGVAAAAWPVVAWPLTSRAQQSTQMRRIGMLLPFTVENSEPQTGIRRFLQELQQLGWTIGRNVRIDTRWAGGDPRDIRGHAAELVALMPDVIFASGSLAVEPLLQATRSVPIVFAIIRDPVGAGFVDSLAKPGGNTTGFALPEYSNSAKWLELLKEVAPNVTRAAVLRDSTITGGGQLGAIQSAAPSIGIEVSPVNMRNADEIERTIAAFARSSNGGLIVTGSPLNSLHRDLIITLATRHKLPAVYSNRFFVASGGLISYGIDLVDQYRLAATYVDRILKGEKPADLPVQAPTKYELAINLKTAKALGLTIPPKLLFTADEVIE
jgi:putative ABC transport system substrate-binding protein